MGWNLQELFLQDQRENPMPPERAEQIRRLLKEALSQKEKPPP